MKGDFAAITLTQMGKNVLPLMRIYFLPLTLSLYQPEEIMITQSQT